MKIVLIEDSKSDALLVTEILKEAHGDFTLTVAERLDEGIKLLRADSADVVLLDLNLPDSNGLQTLINLHKEAARIPIIVMTGLNDEALALQAVRSGAQDYLVKGNINSDLLRRTLAYAIERKRTEEDLFMERDKLRDSRRAALNMMEDLFLASKALKESEERFRSVLDNSQDVIYRFNIRSGHYDYISPSAEKVVGFTAGELIAMDHKTVLSMIHPDDLPVFREKVESLKSGESLHVEYRQRTKNGDYRWISNNMSVQADEKGKPLYRNCNLRDITNRKEAEENLKTSNDELRRFNKYAVGRELRIIELKKEINSLCQAKGEPARYKVDFD